MEYIYGKNTIMSFLEANLLKEVYLLSAFQDNKIIEKLKNSKIKISYKNSHFLDEICKTNKHQGIVGIIQNYTYHTLNDLIEDGKLLKKPVILMLDGIEDPHNFGAIIRTCEALGVNGIIIGKHNSCPLNSTVAKVSTGAIANIKIAEVTNLTQAIKTLKENNYWIVEAEAFQGRPYYEIEYNMPTVLVVGSEGFGISTLVKKQSDFNVYIPMTGKVNSLNVSVATAILLAQIVR